MHNCIGIFILTSYNNKEDRDEKNGKCAFAGVLAMTVLSCGEEKKDIL